MENNDRREFAKLVVSVAELIGKEVSENAMSIWWSMLERYELSAVRDAFDRHLRDPERGRFMPAPADIIRHIEGTAGERALGAWTKVNDAIRYIGPHRSVAFDDPLIHNVMLDMGGWEQMCLVTNEELPFKAIEFQKRYNAELRQPRREFPKRLPGIAETHNAAHGLEFNPARDLAHVGNPLLMQTIQGGYEPGRKADVKHISEVKTQDGGGA